LIIIKLITKFLKDNNIIFSQSHRVKEEYIAVQLDGSNTRKEHCTWGISTYEHEVVIRKNTHGKIDVFEKIGGIKTKTHCDNKTKQKDVIDELKVIL